MARIDKIIFNYKDALACGSMVGGEQGQRRAHEGFKTFKKNLTTAVAETECDFYLMSAFPQDVTKYEESYVFLNTNETKLLYYIKSDGTDVKVTINNFEQFEEELNGITQYKLGVVHLSDEQVKTLITSNTDHAPEIGLTKKTSKSLLEKTICLKPQAFLTALSICNDFESFSMLLDKFENDLVGLVTSDLGDQERDIKFFAKATMHAASGRAPIAADFTRYKEMRAAMLELSATPDGDVIRTVVTQFENQFAADNSENAIPCPIL